MSAFNFDEAFGLLDIPLSMPNAKLPFAVASKALRTHGCPRTVNRVGVIQLMRNLATAIVARSLSIPFVHVVLPFI